MEQGELAQWAYKTTGQSTDFRESNLWSILDPLSNSTILPEGLGKSIEEIIETTTPNSNPTTTSTDNEAVNDDPLSATTLTQTKPLDDLISADNTTINYNVFFQE